MRKLRDAWECKLTLISAPPGYGKTTLVTQFAQHSRRPVVWHTIEERERDVPSLYAQCLVVLENVVPGIRRLAPPYGYGPGDLAALIADFVREHLADDFLYVLDDVQILAGAPAAETFLRTLVSLVPPGFHLLLLSRILPELPLLEMIARQEVLAIGQEELRLTPEEVFELGYRITGSPPAETTVKELMDRLEGWPAGTVLAFRPLPKELARVMLSGGEGPEALFEGLSTVMIDAQPPGVRDFLLASSTLTRLTPELCTLALGMASSTERLAEVQARSLFLARVTGGLAYHTLFRAFLQRRLKATDPTRFKELHDRAAHYFEEIDQLEDAFEHYLAAGSIDRTLIDGAVRLVERVAHSYFSQGRVETLLSWNEDLKSLGVVVPRLHYRCAMIHIDRYEYPQAESELTVAEAAFSASADEVGLAEVQLQSGMIKLQRGEYGQAMEMATHLAEFPAGEGNVRGRALNIMGVARLQIGDSQAAAHDLEEAVLLYKTYADAYALSHVLQSLGVTYWRLGRLSDALAQLQEVVALRRSLGSTGALALALTILGYYFAQFGDYEQATIALQEGLSATARVPSRRAESYLLYNLADVQANRGALDEALRLHHRALERIGESEPSLRCTILTGIATVRRWQGNLHEAIALAEEANRLSASHSISMEGGVARLVMWVAKAELSDPRAALTYLDEVASELRQQHEQFALLRALAVCAHVAVLASDTRLATEYLQSALELAQRIGTLQPLVVEVLHSTALEAHITRAPARYSALIRELNRLREAQVKTVRGPEAVTGLVGSVVYSLRVYTLGQEKVICDGKMIRSSEWRPGVRDLFLYLLFNRPQSREDIGLTFWPDSTPKQLRSIFHVTIHRIREALGENVIAYENGLYRVNPELNLWCDADELEALAARARLLPFRDARTEDLWRRAVALYNGDFLLRLDADWVDARRESLRETYIEALAGLGECARMRGDFRDALSCFKRALDLDPYREDIHQSVMMCYAAKGAKQKMLAHLEQLQRLLREELAIDVSGETLSLVKSFLG